MDVDGFLRFDCKHQSWSKIVTHVSSGLSLFASTGTSSPKLIKELSIAGMSLFKDSAST